MIPKLSSKQKKALKATSLLAIEFERIAERFVQKYSTKIQSMLEFFNKFIMSELNKEKFFEIIGQQASEFRINNEYLFENTFENRNEIKRLAYLDINSTFNTFVRPLVDTVNRNLKFKDILFSNSIDGYNLGGLFSAYSVFINYAFGKSIKKGYYDDENINDSIDELFKEDPDNFDNQNKERFKSSIISLVDTLGKEFMQIEINYFLKDEKVLKALYDRVNKSVYITDSDFNDMKEILINVCYENGRSPRDGAKALKQKFSDLSESRSKLIARTEMTTARNDAIIEQGRRINAEWKYWSTMDDEKVRTQHMTNQHTGPVPFESTFGGGSKEFAPSRCESPYNCRCALQLVPKPENLTFYWNGSQYVEFDVA